jgi:hypothetical protein
MTPRSAEKAPETNRLATNSIVVPTWDIGPRWKAAFDAVWIVLAVLQMCQTIIFSAGERIPGNLTDARFNNLILEHMYHALRGWASFLNPQQFYPEQGTLMYSDAHWGTFLYYSLFRFLGFSIEGAFQAWSVLTALLNASAAWILMRTLRAPWWSCGPLAFIASAHFMIAGKLGHPQVFPIFAVCLALAALFKWSEERRPAHLALFFIAYAYVHLAYIYYGFFFSVVVILLVPLLVIADWHGVVRDVRAYRWTSISLILAAVSISTAALIWLYLPYAGFAARRGWTNPMSLLQDFSPTISAWFSAQWMSWLYGKTFNLSVNVFGDYEKRLFPGFLLLFLPFFAIGASAVRWKERSAKVLLAMAITIVMAIGFFTSFGVPDGSLFLWLAKHVEKVRAFRAPGRIAYVLLPLQVGTLALILRELDRSKGFLRILAGLLLGFGLVESAGFSQAEFSFSKRDNQRYVLALAGRLKEGNSSGPFALITDKPQSIDANKFDLDAFEAALLSGRPSVNGYSGSEPAWVHFFRAEPTASNLDRALIEIKMPPRSVEAVLPEALLNPVRKWSSAVLHLPSREWGRYEWGDRIDFGAKGTSGEFVVSGMGFASDTRPTVAGEASFLLKVPPPSEDELLKVRAVPYCVPPLKEQVVNVKVNGAAIGVWHLTAGGPAEYTLKVPAALLRGRDRLTMTWSLPTAQTPKSLHINDDDRLLSVGVSELSFVPVNTARSANFYVWGQTVMMGDRASDPFVAGGFDPNAGTWRWTLGSKGTLHMAVNPTGRDRFLKFEAIPLLGGSVHKQVIGIRVNQQNIGSIELTHSWAEQENLTIPAGVLSKSTLDVEFSIPGAQSPRALGVNDDPRVLGLALRWFRIE